MSLTVTMSLARFNDIIKDAVEVECREFPGRALELLDYKAMCSSDTSASALLVVGLVELLVLVGIVVKLAWDCVEYRRSGNLPWCARKLCWSVPGIPRPRWGGGGMAGGLCSTGGGEEEVARGSSGYLTASSGGSGGRPGGRESSTVRFLPSV